MGGAPKHLATLSYGRVQLQASQGEDIAFGHIARLVAKVNSPRYSVGSPGRKILANNIRDKVCKERHPIREVLIYLLTLIDKYVGGPCRVADILDGTSTLYDGAHTYVRDMDLDATISRHGTGYRHFVVGHFRNERGKREPVKIGMHVVMCWLRWGDAPNDMKAPVVRHDWMQFNRSGCLGLACLKWGEQADNVCDKKKSKVYKAPTAQSPGPQALHPKT